MQVSLLTFIETEILKHLGAGATDKEVACRLLISESAARKHVNRLVEKLGVRNRAEAAALARSRNVGLTMVGLPPFFVKNDPVATPDYLAELVNQRDLWGSLEREIAKAQQRSQALSVVLLEIELTHTVRPHSYMWKDTFSCAMFKIFDEVGQKGQLAARYGGNHFILTLPDTSKKKAFLIGAKVLQNIQGMRFEVDSNLIAALGVSTLPEDGVTVENLLYAADRLLRHSRQVGGNRISIFRATK